MFYTLELLCKQRGGRFSCVYRAGTIGIKSIKDEDLDKINVVQLGQEIYEMVATKSMKVEDRLALRLSAILTSGLVRIHAAQTIKLLDQCEGLAYVDTADLVRTQSTSISSPELVVKKRKPRKKTAPRTTMVLDEYVSPVIAAPVQRQTDGDDNIVELFPTILPQQDEVDMEQLLPSVPVDFEAMQRLQHSAPSADSPIVRGHIMTVQAEIHLPPVDTAVPPLADISVRDEIVPEIVNERGTQDEPPHSDQVTMPPPKLLRSSTTPKPIKAKGPEYLKIVERNRPRKINRELILEAKSYRPKHPLIGISFNRGELEIQFDKLESNLNIDGILIRAADDSNIVPDNVSIEKLRMTQSSLTRLDISKSYKENLVPEHEESGIHIEGIAELPPIVEELIDEEVQDFNKLSKRAQQLLRKLQKLSPSQKVLIEDLCRKPVQKREVLILFQALLEIHANTDIIDLVTKNLDADLYLDYIFIK